MSVETITIPRSYGQEAKTTDSYWIYKNKYYYQLLARYYQRHIPKGSNVLHIGCRSGFLLNVLEPSIGIGLERDEAFVREGEKKYPHLSFVQGGFDQLEKYGTQYQDVTFDYIIIPHYLMREYDIQKFFERLRQFCTPRTRILFNFCTDFWRPLLTFAEFIKIKRVDGFYNWLQLSDMENLLELSGFEVIKKEKRILFPLHIPLISAVLNKISSLPLLSFLCLENFMTTRMMQRPQEQEKSTSATCSIIIPCKNEKGNIENAIKRTPMLGRKTEIIFVEGGSSDGTAEEIERVMQLYPNTEQREIRHLVQTKKGKKNAVWEAFEAAQGDVLIILDADLTVPPEELPNFWRVLNSGYAEFVNGVRLVYDREKGSMQFLNLIANKSFGILFSWMFGQRIRDTLCGTKVLWRKDWQKIAYHEKWQEVDPFGDFHLLFGAVERNLKIVDVPVHYKAREYGSTQIRRFYHALFLIKMCLIAFWEFKLE